MEVLPPEGTQGHANPRDIPRQGKEKDAPPGGGASFFSHRARFTLSLALAGIADAAQAVFPPDWIFVDVAMAAAFLMIWGMRWEIAAVLIPELIPGMSVFPTWSLLAVYLGQKYGGGPSK